MTRLSREQRRKAAATYLRERLYAPPTSTTADPNITLPAKAIRSLIEILDGMRPESLDDQVRQLQVEHQQLALDIAQAKKRGVPVPDESLMHEIGQRLHELARRIERSA
jgi:hypothetical protein